MATRLEQLDSAGVTFDDPDLRNQYDEAAIDALDSDEFDALKRILEKVKCEYQTDQTIHARWL